PKVEGVNGIDDLLYLYGPEYVGEMIAACEDRAATQTAPKSAEAKSDEPPILDIVRVSDVEVEEVDWLWRPYIPLRKMTMRHGVEGVGKSWLLPAHAAAVTKGHGLPGGEEFESGNVLMMSAEDCVADTIKPRLLKAGADVTRVFALNEPLSLDEMGLRRLEIA